MAQRAVGRGFGSVGSKGRPLADEFEPVELELRELFARLAGAPGNTALTSAGIKGVVASFVLRQRVFDTPFLCDSVDDRWSGWLRHRRLG